MPSCASRPGACHPAAACWCPATAKAATACGWPSRVTRSRRWIIRPSACKKPANWPPVGGVQFATELADLSDWAPETASLDAVILIYTHLPGSIRQAAHRRLAQGLKPGGWLILEAFHPAQLSHSSGGPKDANMLYTPEQLSADFDGLLAPVLAWQGEVTLSEGPGHQGLAHVTRWVGQRLA